MKAWWVVVYSRNYLNIFICSSSQEQTRQHAVTIVAMEERLLRLTRQNKQLEQEAMYAKQVSGRYYLK